MIALDTSVVVAAFASWHEDHAATLRSVSKGARLIGHVAGETYEPGRSLSRRERGRYPSRHRDPGPTRRRYLIRLMMLNIGMYRAMTAAPTAPPMIAIMSGSISDVSASTAAWTSLL